MKKRILHLITGVEKGGGAENMLSQTLPVLEESYENAVCVLVGRGSVGKELQEKGIKVNYLDMKGFSDISIIWKYRKFVRDFHPNIQINYLFHADIFGRVFGKIFGVKKIIASIRNIHKDKKFWLFLDRITLPLVHHVLTNSETAKKFYIQELGVKKEKITCIPNGVDTGAIHTISIDTKKKKLSLGVPENALVIGSVARMEKQKDIPTLVEAFSLFHKEDEKSFLLLVGHGKEKDAIRTLAEELGVSKYVIMLEKRKDVLELLVIMDIFVLSSLKEGMSNALLEAMAMKKAIVISDIEENRELVECGKEGYCFERGNAQDLLEKLKHIEEKSVQIDFGERAFQKVQQKYDIVKIQEQCVKFLEKV
jgi:glycosyltransferase involved in cell wall biosynthesis